MDNSGWVKLHRKAFDNFLYKENRPLTRREAWEDILLRVNYSDGESLFGNEVIPCKRGQSTMSLDTWGKIFNWDKSKVKRFFDLLQNNSMIVIENLHKTTRITVCKYEYYQGDRNGDETQMKRICNGDETWMKPIKEEKEKKEEKEDSIIPQDKKPKKPKKPKIEIIYHQEIIELNEWAKTYFDEKFINQKSLEIFDQLTRIDLYGTEEIKTCIQWARNDSFWTTNFLSPVKLRSKNKDGIKFIDVFRAKFLQKSKTNGNSKGITDDEFELVRQFARQAVINQK